MTGLCALGLTLSTYLGWHYLAGGLVLGCGGGSPCDQVLNSRWSSVAGIVPVSGLAAGAYLAMLVSSLFLGSMTEAPVRRLAWRAMIILTGAAAGSAAWFIILQKWNIGAFCPYCMATHITSLLLAALVIWRAPRQFEDSINAAKTSAGVPRRTTGRLPAVGLALTGLALAGILAICQIHFVPPGSYRAGESQDNQPVFDLHAVPMVGSPDATNIVTLLFDYKCPHCQRLHLMLDEVVRQYGGKLAFVLCPSPMNTQCNPYIPRDADEFKGSCELAKVALAVWVAKREAFPVFDRWMFSYETGDTWHARTLDAARAKAIELVGQAKFDAAQTDPWVSRYMQSSVRIYGNTVQSGVTAIPKLVFGPRWVVPQPNDADDLVSILHNSLGLLSP